MHKRIVTLQRPAWEVATLNGTMYIGTRTCLQLHVTDEQRGAIYPSTTVGVPVDIPLPQDIESGDLVACHTLGRMYVLDRIRGDIYFTRDHGRPISWYHVGDVYVDSIAVTAQTSVLMCFNGKILEISAYQRLIRQIIVQECGQPSFNPTVAVQLGTSGTLLVSDGTRVCCTDSNGQLTGLSWSTSLPHARKHIVSRTWYRNKASELTPCQEEEAEEENMSSQPVRRRNKRREDDLLETTIDSIDVEQLQRVADCFTDGTSSSLIDEQHLVPDTKCQKTPGTTDSQHMVVESWDAAIKRARISTTGHDVAETANDSNCIRTVQTGPPVSSDEPLLGFWDLSFRLAVGNRYVYVIDGTQRGVYYLHRRNYPLTIAGIHLLKKQPSRIWFDDTAGQLYVLTYDVVHDINVVSSEVCIIVER